MSDILCVVGTDDYCHIHDGDANSRWGCVHWPAFRVVQMCTEVDYPEQSGWLAFHMVDFGDFGSTRWLASRAIDMVDDFGNSH